MPDVLVPYTEEDKANLAYTDSLIQGIEVREEPTVLAFFTDHTIFHRMPNAKAVGRARAAMELGFREVFYEMELRLMEHKRFAKTSRRPFTSTSVEANVAALMEEVEKIHMGVGKYMFRLNRSMPDRFDPTQAIESFNIRMALTYVNHRVFYLIAVVHRTREKPNLPWKISPVTEFQMRWMA